MADKHNIPKGKMHNNYRLLSDHIVCKITQRNNIRRANTCDPALKLLNEEITFDIQKHKQTLWKEPLDAHWDHNTHSLWKTILGLSNRAHPPTLNTFSTKIATTYKQFTNTVKHATHKTNRSINRATHKTQGYNITLTTTQIQEPITQSKNNNSQGPDKPDIDKGTSYRPISLLSVIAKTLVKSPLPYITANIPNTPTQHGYKTQHSTVKALHTVNNTVAKAFNQIPPCANNHCSTRYEQSFRHNKHTHTYQKAATDQHSRYNH